MLLLIPTRLGIELNPAYLRALNAVFQFPQCVGVAGGRQGLSITSKLSPAIRTRTGRRDAGTGFFGGDTPLTRRSVWRLAREELGHFRRGLGPHDGLAPVGVLHWGR